MMRRVLGIAALILLVLGATGWWYFSSSRTRSVSLPLGVHEATPQPTDLRRVLPRPAHVIVVIEENKSFDDIAGNSKEAPYLNELIPHAALFTQSYGVAHPSQPNYFALFAGRTNSDGDACAVSGIPPTADNLGTELLTHGLTFVGYAEGLPAPGYRGCIAGDYARKHAPWAYFTTIPASAIQPFTAFPHDYAKLPTVAFLIPDLQDDMHSGSIAHGDAWLRRTLSPLVAWAARHETLIIITWDESSAPLSNHIPTLFVGPMVRPGRYAEPITHYAVLRTIEDMYGLPHAGHAGEVQPIVECWRVPSAR
jgi:phosphatidylinositol-3-phosphatase